MKRSVVALVVLVLVVGILPVIADGEGQSLYDSKCAMCHGKDGVAKKMAENSANLNDPEWQKTATVETITQVITDGKGKMPKFSSKLDETQIQQIAEYVKTLK